MPGTRRPVRGALDVISFLSASVVARLALAQSGAMLFATGATCVRLLGGAKANGTRWGLASAFVALLAAAPAAAAPVSVPADGTAYYGVNLDWGLDSPAAYTSRSGLAPAQYGDFAHMPLTSSEKTNLASRVDVIKRQEARLFLTIEPGSLSNVTAAAVDDLATVLADYNAKGVDVFLRFAHEMNGSWYAWGQQPTAYKAAFQRVADSVHAKAPRTAMVWAPNYGGGYPYPGSPYEAKPGTSDFTALDTDGNGTLTMADDPYGPYYPGDAYVDWVGLTAYHFGNAWPWGENEVPEPAKFPQFLRGTYTGSGRYEDQSAVPDFYEAYAAARSKPMLIAETGALFNEAPPTVGASELEIKRAWVEQVYSSATRVEFPLVKLVNWFEFRKYEGETKSTLDWRATENTSVLGVLRTHVTADRYVFAGVPPGPTPGEPAPAATVPAAPTSLTGTASSSKLSVSWRAPSSDGGSSITVYRACLDTGACRNLPATSTTATFDRLQRRTIYRVTVRPVNAVGPGASAFIDVKTKWGRKCSGLDGSGEATDPKAELKSPWSGCTRWPRGPRSRTGG